jgi:hypothetical protein
MAKQTINIGTAPNDGTGTPLRTAFDYCNLNFTELYTAVGPSGNNIVVPGSATITGDLTVDTSTLKVDSANNRVGIGTASPGFALDIIGSSGLGVRIYESSTGNNNRLQITQEGTETRFNSTFTAGSAFYTWQIASSEQMRLNSTGLGVGATPSTYKLEIGNGGSDTRALFNPNNAFAIGVKNGSNQLGGWIGSTGNNILTFSGNDGTMKVTIDSSGNVGVGVTPSAWSTTFGLKATQVYNSALASNGTSGYLTNNAYYAGAGYTPTYINASSTPAQGIVFNSTGVNDIQFLIGAAGTAGNAITFTQAMTLTANSNLLIGTTTDVSTVKMQVWSPDSNNIVYFRNSNATTPYGPSIRYTAATPNNTGSEFLYCEDSTALRASLRSNGGLANYQANNVSLSDSRLKTDIKPLASYWNKIKSLELVTFKYKDQTHSDDNIGLIAQQVESVAPELVDVDGFGETPADGVPLKTIYTTDLYHASIKALQEAMARIEALEAKLA